MKTLRIKFVCIPKILSAIRQNEQIRTSKSFISAIKKEIELRINANDDTPINTGYSSLFTSFNSDGTTDHLTQVIDNTNEGARYFYNECKIRE